MEEYIVKIPETEVKVSFVNDEMEAIHMAHEIVADEINWEKVEVSKSTQ